MTTGLKVLKRRKERPMQKWLSSIILSDHQSVRLDPGAKSKAYFCRRNPVRVDHQLLMELKEIARGIGDRNVRLCLHESPEAAFHQMIILEHRGKYYRPHKHLTKGEAYHLIEGEMAVFVFDEDGRVADACRLDPRGNFLYRVGPNMYHGVMPLTALVLYHESKPGPFLGDADSVYPSWAPEASDTDGIAEYTQRVLQALEVMGAGMPPLGTGR